MTILVASTLTLLVFGLLAATLLGMVKLVVVTSSQHPMLPYGLALGAAWLLTVPVCVWVINASSLSELAWGHAGEMFLLPFLPVSLAAFAMAYSLVKKHVAHQN